VHFNTKYGSYDEAVSREDGLAIFVFLFKVSLLLWCVYHVVSTQDIYINIWELFFIVIRFSYFFCHVCAILS